MSQVMPHNTDLEKLIAEVRSADGAGVFGSTRVDVAALVEAPAVSRLVKFYERALVALPVAACLVIVVGLASLTGGPMGSMNGVSPSPMVVATAVPSPQICGFEILSKCLTGPGLPAADECMCVDFDADGDVDMRDMSSYQRQTAAVN